MFSFGPWSAREKLHCWSSFYITTWVDEHWLQTLSSSYDITSWIYEQHWSLSTTWVDGSSDVSTCAAWCHQAPQHLTPIAAASLENALNMFYQKLPLLWIERYLYCSKVRKVSDFSGHWPENNLTLNFPSLPFASKRCYNWLSWSLQVAWSLKNGQAW